MANACIYTLEPLEQGGVIAKVREVESVLRRFKHDIRLLYNATEQVPTTTLKDKINYFIHARPHWETSCGFNGFAIPHWPLPVWMSYIMPALFAPQPINNSDIHVVVSGSNHCGLAAALHQPRYVLWTSTLYEDELQGKAIAGDRWAQKTLNSFGMKLLTMEERVIFERATLILANGDHIAQGIRNAYPAVANKVRVVIYPVDTDFFKPDLAQRDPSRPYILFTARINDSRKNVGMLFRAFAQVRSHFPNLRLILTGNTPDESIQRLLIKSNIENAVEFVGYQTRENLVKLYQGAELFALSSSQEGLGISILEALACGVPVVSTKCGGPEGVITSGDNGILVENGNAAALADGITELLSNPTRLEAMRARSAQFARETFSKNQVEQKLLDAFRTVYAKHFS